MRVVYEDYSSSFDELLEKGNSCNIHDRILQKLVECPYALRNELKLKSIKIHAVKYDIETASFIDARAWNSLPIDLKESKSLELFKSKINKKKKRLLKTTLASFVNLTSN